MHLGGCRFDLEIIVEIGFLLVLSFMGVGYQNWVCLCDIFKVIEFLHLIL